MAAARGLILNKQGKSWESLALLHLPDPYRPGSSYDRALCILPLCCVPVLSLSLRADTAQCPEMCDNYGTYIEDSSSLKRNSVR